MGSLTSVRGTIPGVLGERGVMAYETALEAQPKLKTYTNTDFNSALPLMITYLIHEEKTLSSNCITALL